jgi:DNA-binding NarL/FixJ family response regulator
MMEMSMIRVLIVDSSNLICGMLTTVLNNEPDIEVIGCATTREKALAQSPASDVALVSATLPDNGADDFIRSARVVNPRLKILVVGLAEAKQEAIRHIESGAAGYVYQNDSVAKLVKHVWAAYRGEALLAPDLAAALMSRLVEWAASPKTAQRRALESAGLTHREREVLHLLEQNMSNREIAHHLVIEVSTTKNHVHNILTKLDVSSRRDLVSYASASQNRL